MLRRRVHITTGDVSGRLRLSCDPDVILAVALHVTKQTDPNYKPTEEEGEAIGKALELLAETGGVPPGVELPITASYFIVRPLTEGEESKANGTAPFNAQYGSIVMGRVFKKLGEGVSQEQLLEALADLPEKPQGAARARLDYDQEVRERKAKVGLVEIDGATGEGAWKAVEEIDPELRDSVIAEIAAHVDRLTRGKASGHS